HGVSLRSTMFPSRTRPPPDNLCPIRSVTRRAESQERARAPEPDSVAWSQARRLVDPEPGLERSRGGEPAVPPVDAGGRWGRRRRQERYGHAEAVVVPAQTRPSHSAVEGDVAGGDVPADVVLIVRGHLRGRNGVRGHDGVAESGGEAFDLP